MSKQIQTISACTSVRRCQWGRNFRFSNSCSANYRSLQCRDQKGDIMKDVPLTTRLSHPAAAAGGAAGTPWTERSAQHEGPAGWQTSVRARQTALDKDRRLNPSLAEPHSDVPRTEQRISHM